MRKSIVVSLGLLWLVTGNLAAGAQSTADGGGSGFYTFEVFRNMLTRAKSPDPKTGSQPQMCNINRAVVDTQNKRLVFVEALRKYVLAIERQAPFLEVDLKYYDVGIA